MFFYISLFFIFLAFSFISEYSKNNELKYITNLYIFLFIFFVSAFRVNVGTDYLGHYLLYEYIEKGMLSVEYKEPLFLVLCLMAQKLHLGYFFVVGAMSFITFYPLYYISKKEKSSLIQIIYFLSFYLLSQCLMRQYTSISLGILGTYFYFRKEREKLGLFWVAMGAMFHLSFWSYFIVLLVSKYIKLNTVFTILLIIVSYLVIVRMNIYGKIGNIFEFTEYGRYLESTSKHNQATELGSGLGVILRYILYIIMYYITLKYVKPRNIFNTNLLFLALFLTDFSSLVFNILVRLRFVFSPLYILPFYFTRFSKKNNYIVCINNYLLAFLILILFMFFIQKDGWGNVPYQSILFTEMRY